MAGTPKRILLVEDEVLIAIAESMVLECNGFSVVSVHDGKTAVSRATREHFDLILMDIDLGVGKMDGTETAQLILQKHDLPIVFLSSHTEPEIVEKTEKITSYGYVLKNSGDTVLLAGIKMAFRLHAAHLNVRQSRKEIEHREQLLTEVGGVAHVGGWELDVETKTVRWTAETYRIHDVPVGDVTSLENAIDFFHPDDRGNLRRSIEHAVEFGTPYDLEIRLITAKGRRLWTRTRCRPESKDGRVVRLVGTFQDITEQKESTRELVENDARMAEALARAHIGLWNWNAATDTVTWSKEMYRIAGLEPSQPAPTYTEHRALYAPSSFNRLQAAVEKSLRSGEEYSLELELLRPDGSRRWVQAVGGAACGDDGKITGLFGTVHDVHYRVSLERDFQESEKRYKTLLESLEDSVYVLDRDWRPLLVNEAGCRSTGRSRDELLGHRLTELFPGIEETEVFQTFDSTMQTRTPGRIESPYAFAGGSTGWYEIRVFPVPEGILCISRDMSERKQIESDLRRSEETWRSLVENSPDFIAIHDEHGRFRYLNQYAEGFSREDVIGTSAYQYMSHESKESFQLRSKAAFETGSMQRLDHSAMGDHGEMRWYENFLIPVSDAEDERNLLVISRDITERKQAERALQEQTELYRRILEASPDAIVQTDLDGTVKFCNPQLLELVHADDDADLVGKDSFEFIAPDRQSNVREYLERAKTGPSQPPLLCALTRSDGTTVESELSVAILKSIEGRSQGYIGVLRDVSEQRAATRQIRQLLTEKELLLKESRHRMKNDLAILDSLLRLQSAQERNHETKESLLEASRRVAAIGHVYEESYAQEDVSEVDGKRLIERISHRMAKLNENRVSVVIDAQPILIPVRIGVLLGIILNELLTNILKYTEQSPGATNVSICLREVENRIIVLEIIDNGAGFPAAVLNGQHWGLGLTIVDGLVGQCNGRIELSNQNGAKVSVQMALV